MKEKQITTALPGAVDFSDQEVLKAVRDSVAAGASPAEFRMFVELAKGTGLNPFKKELWFIKAGGRAQIMTGINGFLAIANNHPAFDGMIVEVDDDQNPKKATAFVYRKDRRYPAVGVALMKEYGKATPIWKQMPRTMLTKVAKSIALREAFPQQMNGLYTAEEMPEDYQAPVEPIKAPEGATEPPVAEQVQSVEPEEEKPAEGAREALKPVVLEDGSVESLERWFAVQFDTETDRLKELQQMAIQNHYAAYPRWRCWLGEKYVRSFEKFYIHKPEKGFVNGYKPDVEQDYTGF